LAAGYYLVHVYQPEFFVSDIRFFHKLLFLVLSCVSHVNVLSLMYDDDSFSNPALTI
jgi:hypothetical protein